MAPRCICFPNSLLRIRPRQRALESTLITPVANCFDIPQWKIPLEFLNTSIHLRQVLSRLLAHPAFVPAPQAPGLGSVAPGSSGAPAASQVKPKRKYEKKKDKIEVSTNTLEAATQKKPWAKKAKATENPPMPPTLLTSNTPSSRGIIISSPYPSAKRPRLRRSSLWLHVDWAGSNRSSSLQCQPNSEHSQSDASGYGRSSYARAEPRRDTWTLSP
ncbi:hypothetical protein FPQ18DRAFT_379145 [Pyronema domesticum]|nr:hypothetical protein FPQ18DRAFT_379145 [Pyronema domesticum]